jgi:hypothetical protein
LVQRRENVPHIAVLWLKFEVHEKVEETGECRGMPVHAGERLYKIEGADKFICIQKLNELLGVIQNGTS